MRRSIFIVLTVMLSGTGCTTLRPIEGTSTEFQQRMNSGELLKIGDRILIVTADQKAHRFTVTGIGAGRIEGRTESVPVDQVVSLEVRQFSRPKTLIVIGGVVLAAGLVVYGESQLALMRIFASTN